MNSKQTQSLEKFANNLHSVRQIPADKIVSEEKDGKVFLMVDGGNLAWPIVEIGKQGGFRLPEIKSYKENGDGDSLQYPGTSAFDAALFGDKHLERQTSGKRAPRAKKETADPAVQQAAALGTVAVQTEEQTQTEQVAEEAVAQ